VLLGFNLHGAHHERPTVPGYLLEEVHHEPVHVDHWWTWLKRAKGLPVERVIEG
jgi:fatty acid desaturase